MVEFDFKAYRRPFADAYRTASDALIKRAGVLIRLRDEDGRVGFGEAAPIESFGTESFVSCAAECSELKGEIEYEEIRPSIRSSPCLQFGIESALTMLEKEPSDKLSIDRPWPICGLVGEIEDLESVERRLEAGYRGLKFKIGKGDFVRERRALEAIVERTGGEIGIRLDANGGLSLSQTRAWLEALADLPVEFLEQPLPKGEEELMIALSSDYPTPLALDESILSADDLHRWRDEHWEGLYVIKPSLAGSRWELIEALNEGDAASLVFSSSLETKIGSAAALSIALETGQRERMLGFGVENLFADRNVGLVIGPFLQADSLPDLGELEELWNSI